MRQLLKDGENWRLKLGDCIEHMPTMPPQSVDFAVFSPPFPSLYAYTSESADIGNSEGLDGGDAKLHLSFFYNQMLRILKPGRVMAVHVAQIPRMKRAGEQGLRDFRGMNIRLAERAGFQFDYDWLVRKNPQAQAIRGKAWELKFQGIETDRTMSRGTLGDYLLKFRVPGENAIPVVNEEVTRNNWIDWAEGCWGDVQETDTLNVTEGRSESDTKHICPLQLEVIRRLILLYSNPGEIVFSPFAGIGSEGYMALGGKSPKTGRCVAIPRRFYGCELKPEYYAVAGRNLGRAVAQSEASKQSSLFSEAV